MMCGYTHGGGTFTWSNNSKIKEEKISDVYSTPYS